MTFVLDFIALCILWLIAFACKMLVDIKKRLGGKLIKDPHYAELKQFKLGKELEFISIVARDGSCTESCIGDNMSSYDNDQFSITCLSITKKTYIASGFNSYVVRLKPEIK